MVHQEAINLDDHLSPLLLYYCPDSKKNSHGLTLVRLWSANKILPCPPKSHTPNISGYHANLNKIRTLQKGRIHVDFDTIMVWGIQICGRASEQGGADFDCASVV